ncbi:GMC oxidoreductase [Plenodomus tracheiphilus IPT5]|uniref:GMC oxidoreductase n=1 Tax=Plenodomus tracheiphilus IPT5 TaxID=1408161 RepID=A0A6A7B3E5_9PLEO|nr:GMC oxidoreductase [Plenodomus tracheiphilus IPT5]
MHLRIPTLALLARALSVQAESYDYLIAGAGTAGLVIASRLSENPKVSVLVIEAGPDVRNDNVVTSGNFSFSNYNTSINWEYSSTPQAGANDRVISFRAGKAIGGTSIVNGMVYIRGEQAQFDAFEKLGNPGWNWDSLFSYGKKGERFEAPNAAQTSAGVTANPAVHGTNGPLTVSFPFSVTNTSFGNSARQAWKSIGVNPVTDVNGGHPHGFVSAPLTLDRDRMRRSSSASSYYEPVDSRPNLKVIQGTVKKILWAKDKNNKAVASGFEYVTPSKQTVQISAKKEVIISASAYRSPLILEASGIGNPTILKKLGVKVKSAVPGVGENMLDHNAMVIVYGTTNNLVGDTPFATLVTAQDVLGNKTAAMAASSGSQISAWAQAASKNTGGAITAKAYEKRFQLQHDLIFKQNVTIAELYPTNLGSAIVSQLWTTHPFSWGSVHLKSLDSFDDPVIDTNIFSLQFDVDLLAAVARTEQKAYSTPPLSTFVAPNQVLPLNATDAQWTSYVRANGANAMHVVGTCAMLPLDLGGVVDSKLKVYGTSNVRVVDASVIPVELTGHTVGPLYAVAEKAAYIIKNDS